MGLRAGAAVVDITPPLGTAMDGYGARVGVSLGVRDPLFCRALVLDDGSSRLALAVCDLIGVGRQLVAQAREQIAATCGIPPEHVLIAATHTHAGPAGVRGHSDLELLGITARKVGGAVALAARELRPAVLKIGSGAVDSVSQNRRHPDWPIDPRLTVLAVEEPDGDPVATVIFFACHATVMNYDNLLLSADYPGAAVRAVERGLGGVALMFNGACGNVNPVWIAQRFSEVDRVGGIIGAEAVKVAAELRPLGPGQRAHNIRWDELTEKPVTRGELVEDVRLAGVSTTLHLPFKPFLTAEAYTERIAQVQRCIDAAGEDSTARRTLAAERSMLNAERAQLRRVLDSGDEGGRTIEIQALRLGAGVAVLGLPGEWFVETARVIEQRAGPRPAGAGVRHLLIACYANDYPGYIVPPQAYPEGGYEAGMTPFVPDAEPLAVAAACDVLARVMHDA